MSASDSRPDYIRILLNCAFIGLGVALLFGFLDYSTDNFWAPWLFTLAGVVLASFPGRYAKVAGMIVILVGVYMLLRYYDVITAPILRYGVGLLLILFGVVNLVRGPTGGDGPQNKTIQNDES